MPNQTRAIKRIFISYRLRRSRENGVKQNPTDEELSRSLMEDAYAHRISYHLRKQPELDVFCYDIPASTIAGTQNTMWEQHVAPHLTIANVFIIFLGGGTEQEFAKSGQGREFSAWKANKQKGKVLIAVRLRGNETFVPEEISKSKPHYVDAAGESLNMGDLEQADKRANDIYKRIHAAPEREIWRDGLPIGYPFEYEKQIIDAFFYEGEHPFQDQPNGKEESDKMLLRDPHKLAAGCLLRWPTVGRFEALPQSGRGGELPESEAGAYRDDCMVVVDARGKFNSVRNGNSCLGKLGLVFPEAGPRKEIMFGRKLEVGIIVSGGLAPGINAVIEGIIERHRQYFQHAMKTDDGVLKIKAFQAGFQGFAVEDNPFETVEIFMRDKEIKTDEINTTGELASRIAAAKSHGGTEITTARHDELQEGKADRPSNIDEIVDRLTDPRSKSRVDILYVIGGEGSMRAAHALEARAGLRKKRLSVVGIPKTMDNDILWVWQSFGFLSAVEKAREILAQLDTESKSNPRLCVMQLFGSDSGFVVSHTALASGQSCLAALIPEIQFSMRSLGQFIKTEYERHKHGILVLAETAVPVDIEDFLDIPEAELSDREKDAVRRFVCSALVRQDEFPDNKAFEAVAEALGKNSDVVQKSESDGKSLVEARDAFRKGSQEPRSRARLVEIVNRIVINNADAWIRKNPIKLQKAFALASPPAEARRGYDLYANPLRKAFHDLDGLIRKAKGSNVIEISVDLTEELHALSQIICLPYEATAIIREVRKAGRPGAPSGPVVIPKQLVCQLCKRLRETFARIFGECYLRIPARRWTLIRDRRVFGQTPDELRTASLKIVSLVLDVDTLLHPSRRKEGTNLARHNHQIFTSEPRHLIRVIPPSCHDIITADRMGRLAVDGAMAGYHDFMISQWLTEFVLVPLPLVVLGRKRVPHDGIFWKSVIASTGQPENLWYEAVTPA